MLELAGRMSEHYQHLSHEANWFSAGSVALSPPECQIVAGPPNFRTMHVGVALSLLGFWAFGLLERQTHSVLRSLISEVMA